mmetsp:Transcript_42191/g.106256  ORF Transcript_42191/g.106256 Transcript_42191/m.106256 type:complete len:115 (-) Transcript_42191:76-420(-)
MSTTFGMRHGRACMCDCNHIGSSFKRAPIFNHAIMACLLHRIALSEQKTVLTCNLNDFKASRIASGLAVSGRLIAGCMRGRCVTRWGESDGKLAQGSHAELVLVPRLSPKSALA